MPDINQDFETLMNELSLLSTRDRKMVERHLSDAEKTKIRKVTNKINNIRMSNEKMIDKTVRQKSKLDINIYSPWLSAHLRDILDAGDENIPEHITKTGRKAILRAVSSNDQYFSKNPVRQISSSHSSKVAFWGRWKTRS